MKENFENFGYRVFIADHLDVAEELFKQIADRVDVLISDIVMPGESVEKFVGRARKKRPDLKILLTSGYSGEELSHEGDVHQRYPFIEKPVNSFSMLSKIRSLIDS
jgi:DNA-binding NtrC family response regulator